MSKNWDFYFCTVDHRPASIFLDLGIRDHVPIAEFEHIAWLQLFMKSPREDGLSSEEEFETLCKIEDALKDAFASSSERIMFVGRNTSDGTRDFYCYADNGTWAESILSSAMVPFASYEFDVGSRHDPHWSDCRRR